MNSVAIRLSMIIGDIVACYSESSFHNSNHRYYNWQRRDGYHWIDIFSIEVHGRRVKEIEEMHKGRLT